MATLENYIVHHHVNIITPHVDIAVFVFSIAIKAKLISYQNIYKSP